MGTPCSVYTPSDWMMHVIVFRESRQIWWKPGMTRAHPPERMVGRSPWQGPEMKMTSLGSAFTMPQSKHMANEVFQVLLGGNKT